MNISILVIGVSGTGKSAVSKELKKRGYKAYDIENIPGLFKMINKKTGKWNKNFDHYSLEEAQQHDWICNKKKLKKIIMKNKGIVFYCGLGSNTVDIMPLFDKVFLLKASIKVLSKRLTYRKTNEFGRTKEVQKWIFKWKKWWENRMIEKGAVVVNANRGIKEVASDIIRKTENKK